MPRPSFDLNADLGEGCGDDAAMLAIVSSANIACGAHAGGGEDLADAVAQAVDHGVAVGAHPSYPDREQFGRRSMRDLIPLPVLVDMLVEQIQAVADAAAAEGASLSHVKAHGALYNDAAEHADIAAAICDAVATASAVLHRRGLIDSDHPDGWTSPILPIVGQPLSVLEDLCQARRIPFIAEAFADRAYLPSGRLAPRTQPGAVLHDPDDVLAQARQIAVEGTVTCMDGSIIAVPAVTLCVHGDTPGAVHLAGRIRAMLTHEGMVLVPPGGAR